MILPARVSKPLSPHKVIPIQQGLKRKLAAIFERDRKFPHKVIPIQQGLKLGLDPILDATSEARKRALDYSPLFERIYRLIRSFQYNKD